VHRYRSVPRFEYVLLFDQRDAWTLTLGQAHVYSILPVDDEPDLLAVWHLILNSEGYDVRCTGNGAEALASVKQRVPDLVITDWMMPLMDGTELCRYLRAEPDLARVPILVHTSAPLPVNAGNACQQKPVPMQLFLTTAGRLWIGRG
jgi:CheY-like chemotaxis protein